MAVKQQQDHSIRARDAQGSHVDGTGGDAQARKLEDRGQGRDAGCECDEHDQCPG
jgi:hypothetical protein